ncbi:MAG: hypothetical protein DMG92_17490, partial [Acidobacteria bacterium]
MPGTPPISVILLVYNHEKYVAEAIRSALRQSFENFELIIINDGSTDKSEEIIRSFDDRRIIYSPQNNQGPAVAANNGILAARGKYVAILCGDDAWYPQRLQKHFDALDRSKYRWAFSWVDVMNENGQVIAGPHVFKQFYDRPQLSQAQILRTSFYDGCPLHTNTAFVERELYLQAGLFHLSSIQAHDFHMWTHLAAASAPLILPERLVKYRVRSELQNLSSAANAGRTWFELYQLYRAFFDDLPMDLFREAFHDKLKNPAFMPGAEYELEKAFLYLHHKSALIRSLGHEKLFQLLLEKEIRAIAESRYGFGLTALYKLNEQVDITNSREYRDLEQGHQTLIEQIRRSAEAREDLLFELEKKDEIIEQQGKALAENQARLEEIHNSKLQRLRRAILYQRFS